MPDDRLEKALEVLAAGIDELEAHVDRTRELVERLEAPAAVERALVLGGRAGISRCVWCEKPLGPRRRAGDPDVELCSDCEGTLIREEPRCKR